jgi:hypothetical protein
MLRSFGAALAVTLAIAPFEFSVLQLTQNDAEAAATFKSALLMPAKTRSFSSGSEYRVCIEGDAPVRMMASNPLTGITTESQLEPSRCAQAIGTMMTFRNDSKVPVLLSSFGGMGGRPGRGPGHSK